LYYEKGEIQNMSKVFNFLFISLMLIGCVASTSYIESKASLPPAKIIEQDRNEMLELAKEMEEERIQAIYIVVISEPEIITAKPLGK